MNLIKQNYIKLCIIGLFMILSIIGFALQDNSAVIYISMLQVILVFAYLVDKETNLIEFLFIGFISILSIFVTTVLYKSLIDSKVNSMSIAVDNAFESSRWMLIIVGSLFWLGVLAIIIETIFKKKISIKFFQLTSNSFKKIGYYFAYFLIACTIISIQFLEAIASNWNSVWVIGLYFITLITSSILFVVAYKVEKRVSA